MDGNQPQPELPQPIEPGQTISPGEAPVIAAQSEPLAAPTPAPTPPAAPTETPVPSTTPPAPTPAYPQDAAPRPAAAPFELADDTPPSSAGDTTWTASEFIAHEKSANWYITLIGGAVILSGVAWLITRDILTPVVILAALGLLAAYGSRKPRELQYTLDNHGITIGEKHYPYQDFRSFSIIEEGAFSSIELMPLKRFAPPISIYYDPANEDAIAEALTPHLPFHPHQPDPVDRLIRRIRF